MLGYKRHEPADRARLSAFVARRDRVRSFMRSERDFARAREAAPAPSEGSVPSPLGVVPPLMDSEPYLVEVEWDDLEHTTKMDWDDDEVETAVHRPKAAPCEHVALESSDLDEVELPVSTTATEVLEPEELRALVEASLLPSGAFAYPRPRAVEMPGEDDKPDLTPCPSSGVTPVHAAEFDGAPEPLPSRGRSAQRFVPTQRIETAPRFARLRAFVSLTLLSAVIAVATYAALRWRAQTVAAASPAKELKLRVAKESESSRPTASLSPEPVMSLHQEALPLTTDAEPGPRADLPQPDRTDSLAKQSRLDGRDKSKHAALRRSSVRSKHETPAARRAATKEASGLLRINSRPWAEVYIDGEHVGSTPQTNLTLAAGRHRVVLVNDAQKLKRAMYVRVAPGEATTRVVNFEPKSEEAHEAR